MEGAVPGGQRTVMLELSRSATSVTLAVVISIKQVAGGADTHTTDSATFDLPAGDVHVLFSSTPARDRRWSMWCA